MSLRALGEGRAAPPGGREQEEASHGPTRTMAALRSPSSKILLHWGACPRSGARWRWQRAVRREESPRLQRKAERRGGGPARQSGGGMHTRVPECRPHCLLRRGLGAATAAAPALSQSQLPFPPTFPLPDKGGTRPTTALAPSEMFACCCCQPAKANPTPMWPVETRLHVDSTRDPCVQRSFPGASRLLPKMRQQGPTSTLQGKSKIPYADQVFQD